MIENTGLFQAYPIHIDVPLEVDRVLFSLAPWGCAILSGMRGKDGQQVDQIILGYEWAIPLWSSKVALSKSEKEELHLARFCTDYALACGQEYCNAIASGQNPPDFVCAQDVGSVNVDCAQFTLGERRKALQMFESLRQRVLESNVRFSNLRGYMVYVWFERHTNQGTALPHHPTEEAQIDSLLDALTQCKPDPNRLVIPSENLPAQAPSLGLIRTEHGAIFYVVPFTSGAPSTDFFARCGFELGLAFTSRHDREEVWEELRRIISKHDKEQIDHLVISSGAPNEKGLVYLAEDALVQFAFEQGVQQVAPKHLKVIYLHVWSAGAIVQLWPNPQFFPQLFPGGFGPSWYNTRS